MNTILFLLMAKGYHVRKINDNKFSVIASYKSQLDEVVTNHNVHLKEWFNSELTVQGVFCMTKPDK